MSSDQCAFSFTLIVDAQSSTFFHCDLHLDYLGAYYYPIIIQ